MTRPSSESGWTLIELLVSMSLFMLILSAALTSFDAFSNNTRRNQDLTDAQVEARNTLDALAKELRNLASPDNAHPDSIELANPYDLVFRSVNPIGPGSAPNDTNLQRVRYCLGGTDNASLTLYRQVEQPNANQALRTFTGASDPLVATGCPVTAANFNQPNATLRTTRVIGQHVTNKRPLTFSPVGTARELFTYRPAASPTTDITQIVPHIYLDINNFKHTPGEVNLTTSAFLRNQNRRPVADIETPTVRAGTPPHILLNGSGSYDPEGGGLTYAWTVKRTADNVTVGTSTRPFYDFTAVNNTKYTVTLVVTDPSPLSSLPATVCAATGTATCP